MKNIDEIKMQAEGEISDDMAEMVAGGMSSIMMERLAKFQGEQKLREQEKAQRESAVLDPSGLRRLGSL